MTEPQDNTVYSIWVKRDGFHFFLRASRHYGSLLQAESALSEEDEDLAFLTDRKFVQNSELFLEQRKTINVKEFLEEILEKSEEGAWEYHLRIHHGTIRYLKSVGIFYLELLRTKRDSFSQNAHSIALLKTMDQSIARYSELLEMGVFKEATPLPLYTSHPEANTVTDSLPQPSSSASYSKSKPVFHDSIPLLDPELRKRCLDRLRQHESNEDHDQYDDVVHNAIKMLEVRLRDAAQAPEEMIGIDLASYAFNPKQGPRLKASNIPSEQQAIHLLFMGLVGHIRNPVSHKRIRLTTERTLQIMGMIDYFLHVIEGAERQE